MATLVENATVAIGIINQTRCDIGNISTSFVIPNGTSIIRDSAFNGSPITSIIIPNSVTSIGNSAFYYCTSLTSINIPDSVTSIGNSAFSGCYNLQNVTLENGFNCNKLKLSSSTKFTVETIVSWLEALADRTGETAYTLTIGTTNLNKLTAEQKAIATNKNWNLA